MEEWVGSIWHKYITKKASTDFDEAKVTFSQVSKSAGMIFRGLGGSPAKRVEAAAPRDYIVRRSFLQKISGSHHQLSLAWQDETSLRLPESIAVFPSKSLNKNLYLWLAALAAQSDEKFNHWAKDNQARVLNVLQRYPSLKTRYYAMLEALLQLRPAIDTLPKAHQALEKSVIQALKEPGSVTHFPMANYAPQAVYLWLYPSANVQISPPDDNELNHQEKESSKDKQESKVARKKTERIQDPHTRDGMMVFRLENLFSWSEFSKMNRAEDDTDDEDAQRVAEDLDKITLSKQQNQKTAKLKIDLDLPSASEDDIPLGAGLKLPEWDYKSSKLIDDRCLLQPMLPKDSSAKKLPANLSSTAKKIRSQFQQLQSVKQWLKAQPQGEELDISAWLDFHIQSKQGPAPQKGLYRSFKSNNRDLSCLLLADISMSTDAHIDDDNRVIDVIQSSMLLFGEALEAVGDEFAMYGFSSVKRHHVRFTMLKNFAEKYNDDVRGRIQALQPGFYTRMGTAIRQATKVLSAQKNTQKLLLILTDGKPNDIDHYEGRFGIEDSHQAILEAKRLGLRPFCITIDQQADEYLPYLFGSDGFTVILNPTALPTKLPHLYHQLTS